MSRGCGTYVQGGTFLIGTRSLHTRQLVREHVVAFLYTYSSNDDKSSFHSISQQTYG